MRTKNEIKQAVAILTRKADRLSLVQAEVLQGSMTEQQVFQKYVMEVAEENRDEEMFFAARDAARFSAGHIGLEELIPDVQSMTAADFAALDQGREGIWNRLYDASRAAASLPELLAAAKTKRYAMARLRRMVLWAYLGLTPGDMPERVPYLRVLAANGTGCRLLSRMREAAAVPVLTRPAQVRRLGPEARRLFELEVRATDLYTLAYPRLSAAGGTEWREGPVILGGPAPC